MFGREAYANRNSMKALGQTVRANAQHAVSRARMSLTEAQQDFEDLMARIDHRARELRAVPNL